jgi:hypothetical protein
MSWRGISFCDNPVVITASDIAVKSSSLLANTKRDCFDFVTNNGFCRMWLRDGHHLLEEPRHAANDVVPSAPFAGEPAPRHHERPHQPRDQQPVEHQTLDEPRFNEEDAPQDNDWRRSRSSSPRSRRPAPRSGRTP